LILDFERFNPRCIGCEAYFATDDNLFWALLIDIKSLFGQRQ